MKNFTNSANPEEVSLLIAFCDLTNFTRFSKKKTAIEIFKYLSHIYEITGDIIEASNGQVIKFIGDAALITFPENRIDAGLMALKKLKETIDAYNNDINYESHLIVKAHYGKVMTGMIGTKNEKRYDVIGSEVNITALLKSKGFAISVEVFRKLTKETRKLFKKHTPTITYISVEEKHY